MNDVALAKPKTDLEKLDQKTLLGLLRSGLSLQQIEVMEEPKLRWFALANDFDFDELKETIGLLAGIDVMKDRQLAFFNGWVNEQGISLEQLQEIARLIAQRSDQKSDADRSRWQSTQFFGYTRARGEGIAHNDLLVALNLGHDLEDYQTLRTTLQKSHEQTLSTLEAYGAYIDALIKARNTDISEAEMLEFIKTSPNKQYYSEYIELRKAGVRHTETCDYIALHSYSQGYFVLSQRGLNHQEIVALAHFGVIYEIYSMFDKGERYGSRITFSPSDVARILRMPKLGQNIFAKLLENERANTR